jgi:hypothetical protein
MDVEKIKPNKQLGSSPGNLFGDWKKRFRLTERKKKRYLRNRVRKFIAGCSDDIILYPEKNISYYL